MMSEYEILTRLEACAAGIERGIEGVKARHAQMCAGTGMDFPVDEWCDNDGRPILAGLYVELGAIYRYLGAAETGGPT